MRFPRWLLLNVALLGIALGLAVDNGRMVEAVVIAVLLLPTLALVAALMSKARR